MLQVLSIDKLLSTSRRLQDELFSITLTKETGDRRAWAGSSTVLIHLGAIRSQNEFVEVLTHELGHIVDLKLLTKNT